MLKSGRLTIACKRHIHGCITGIGNPEPQYAHTRHNVGLLMLDLLRSGLGGSEKRFVPCNTSPKVKRCQLNDIMLLRADGDFINLSGRTVVPLWNKLSSGVQHLVIHDELSLPLGKVQLRKPGRSLRGHNGLKDISKYRGDHFFRLAVGIGRPDERDPEIVARYVLSKFRPQELEILQNQSLQKAMHHVNSWMVAIKANTST